MQRNLGRRTDRRESHTPFDRRKVILDGAHDAAFGPTSTHLRLAAVLADARRLAGTRLFAMNVRVKRLCKSQPRLRAQADCLSADEMYLRLACRRSDSNDGFEIDLNRLSIGTDESNELHYTGPFV